MNSKQVVAAVAVVVLLVILVYPVLATATISIQLQSAKFDKADHVYAQVGNVWVHMQGPTAGTGWQLVSNQTQTVDLVALGSTTMALVKGQVPLGGYDSVRMDISNVTWVFNKTTTTLTVEETQIQANLDFNAQAGRQATITLALGGSTQVIAGTKFFLPNMNATLTNAPGQ